MIPRAAIFDRKPLGQLLLSHGIVQPEQLKHAIDTQAGGRHQKLLGEILVEQNICTEEQITQTLAQAYGVPFALLEPKLVDPKALGRLPASFVSDQLIVPMFVVEGVLTVAVAEPANVFLTEEIVRLSGLTVQVVAATARDIRSTLAAMLPSASVRPVAGDIDDLIEAQPDELQIPDTDAAAADDRLARYWLQAALSRHAGEILIEPGDGRSRIRLREAGRWRELSIVPADLCRQAVDRLIQLACGGDSRHGTLRCQRQGRAFDVSVAVTSTRFGPCLLLRLPDPATRPARLDKLGLPPTVAQAWQTLTSASRGLLLITGPVASGKSTTLHATLRELLTDDGCVATVEEPLVHVLDGVTQLTSGPGAIEALLTGPADCCAVDPLAHEAACVAAAGAGRLVVATVAHTDVAAVLHRLRLDVRDDVALSAGLTGILSQRLVRKLCPACKQATAPTEADRAFFGDTQMPPEALFTPRGCPQCDHGYLGRTGLFQLWTPNEAMFDRPIGRASRPRGGAPCAAASRTACGTTRSKNCAAASPASPPSATR